MILLLNSIKKYFAIKWKEHDFTPKNVLEKIFLHKNCIGNDFYFRNKLEIVFIIEMHGKQFYYNKNTLEMIFIIKCAANDFTTKMHWNIFLF